MITVLKKKNEKPQNLRQKVYEMRLRSVISGPATFLVVPTAYHLMVTNYKCELQLKFIYSIQCINQLHCPKESNLVKTSRKHKHDHEPIS